MNKPKTKSNRIYLLMAEFEGADALLEQVVARYFSHLGEREWKRRAALQQFPFPVFRAEKSQKSPWMVSLKELADYLDHQEAEAAKDWRAAS